MQEARLRWLLRRGMKELDIVVARYYQHRYPVAPEAERATFVQLVEQVEDPDIWAWTMGYADVPAEYADVVEQLRIHR